MPSDHLRLPLLHGCTKNPPQCAVLVDQVVFEGAANVKQYTCDDCIKGLGFAWSPIEQIQRELKEGSLKPLRLIKKSSRFVEMYISFANEDFTGPATRALAHAIQEQVQRRKRNF